MSRNFLEVVNIAKAMVNDKTIDARNATFWCAFNDDVLISKLDEASDVDAEGGKRLAKIVKTVEKKAKQKAEGQLEEGMWDFVQIANQTAFPLATGNPFQPNFRGMDPTSGELSMQDQQKNNVIAGAAAAAVVGTSLVPGGWAALGSAIAGALGTAGAWLASTAASTIAAVGTGGVMAIVGGLVSVSTYLYPRIAKLIKDICRSGEIAKCKFEADGEKYLAVFSLKKKRWQLVFQSNRMLSASVNVPAADVKSFFDSEFFNKFLAQCSKYADAIYKDNKRMKCLEVLAKMADKKCQKDMQQLLDAKAPIEQYMFAGSYTTT